MSNMTPEELRKRLIVAFKDHHGLLPASSYLDDVTALFADLCTEVIGTHLPGQEKINQHIDIQRTRLTKLTGREIK